MLHCTRDLKSTSVLIHATLSCNLNPQFWDHIKATSTFWCQYMYIFSMTDLLLPHNSHFVKGSSPNIRAYETEMRLYNRNVYVKQKCLCERDVLAKTKCLCETEMCLQNGNIYVNDCDNVFVQWKCLCETEMCLYNGNVQKCVCTMEMSMWNRNVFVQWKCLCETEMCAKLWFNEMCLWWRRKSSTASVSSSLEWTFSSSS